VVVGAGIGGLAAAVRLAARGLEVELLESGAGPGGKMREVAVGASRLDAGPTVLTMRWVFDELFAEAGASFAEAVPARPAGTIARHAWSERERLDLHADEERSADAIAAFAGPAEARRYRRFCARARDIHDTLERPFLRAQRPGPVGLARSVGLHRLGALWRIRPFSTLWRALGEHFHDARLRQLFARYATYVGSSPFEAPATLMLIAHVEREGVWLVEGGMYRLAEALARLAVRLGVRVRYGARVEEVLPEAGRARGVRIAGGERVRGDRVVVNADAGAVAAGLLGQEAARAVPAGDRASRSLSAVTWLLHAETRGFPLLRHTVFFGRDYRAEFEDVFGRRRLPRAPTVYVCAQDRGGEEADPGPGPERLLCLVNAPPTGDVHRFGSAEIGACETEAFGLLQRCGLRIGPSAAEPVVVTPDVFERLFPGTGGALYGRASHGWRASFRRPAARTAMPGLYLAGGSAHPGAGVPMAALSGARAAEAVLADLASSARSRTAATSGGTSTGCTASR